MQKAVRRLIPSFLAALVLLAGLAALCPRADAASSPSGGAWQAVIGDHDALPPRLIAVDKKRQQLFVFEKHSPFRLKSTYVCTTGQVPGDKLVQGDLKTPEGIYFVVRHLTSGLDFLMYGNEAYTLNYPNPVDRLRRKTGYGIWIHGKGEALTPLQTQGCVAMRNGDLAVLGAMLAPGTPVALTSSLSQEKEIPRAKAEDVLALKQRVQDWAAAWSQRSPRMFEFYDQDAYSIAQGEPFSSFRAQKERLFKTLGWIKTTVRDIQVLEGPDYWVTWFYQDYAASNLSTRGVRRLYWGKDNSGEFRILGMEWLPGLTTGTLLASAEPAVPPVTDAMPRSEEEAVPLASALEQSGRRPAPRQTAEPPADASASSALAALDLPPALPAQRLGETLQQDALARTTEPTGQSDASGSAGQTDDGTRDTEDSPERTASADRASVSPQPDAGAIAAPAETEHPEKAEDKVRAVAARIEVWRRAWAGADLDAYAACYAPSAEQSGRKGPKAIRRQKEQLWKRKAPASVELSGIRIVLQKDAVRADMHQVYADTSGGGDMGIKTLIFIRHNGHWLIDREEWSPLEDEAGD